MAILWRMKKGNQWYRYCHLGYQDDEMVSGHPVPVAVGDPDDEQAMRDDGWTTDGRCWFCPEHSRFEGIVTMSGEKWRRMMKERIKESRR